MCLDLACDVFRSRLCAVTDRKLREKDMIEKARISHDRTRKFIQGTIDK